MSCFVKSSGFLVMMSTAPVRPPSTRLASAVLRTTTWLTSSEGSMVKLTLRPAFCTWLSTNQSPDDTTWPLIRVCVRLALVPRIDTRSFSSKPPSLAPAELMVTPGTRCSESAMFLSGILPMSSAVMTSTCVSALRLRLSDFSCEARMPVTTTVSSAGCGVFCAKAEPARPSSRQATAPWTGVAWSFMARPWA